MYQRPQPGLAGHTGGAAAQEQVDERIGPSFVGATLVTGEPAASGEVIDLLVDGDSLLGW
ncbi:MAG TPA: hypothetical protein VIR27_04605 [Mycobacteriales bacterium]|jgi:hypothetical protein